MARTKKDLSSGTVTCTWAEDSSGDYWETSCSKLFVLNDGTPKENDMRFCCYCGKPIKQVTTMEAAESL